MFLNTPQEATRRVRRNALILGSFTFKDLVRITGIHPCLVRSRVNDLRHRGFLISEHLPRRREVIYRLADDPAKRLSLSLSLERYYTPYMSPVATQQALFSQPAEASR